MISTVINQELGLEFPLFQGGMAWVADASLAAGVSNAGGLGIIAAMNSNGEQLRAEIKKCKELTDKPFGVNIMLMSPFADEVAEVVVEEGVKVVTTGAGNPGKYMAKWRCGKRSSRKKNGKERSVRCDRRGRRKRRPCRRAYNNGSCAPGC